MTPVAGTNTTDRTVAQPVVLESVRFDNLDTHSAYQTLQVLAAERTATLVPHDIPLSDIPLVAGLRYNFAAKMLLPTEIDALTALATEAQLIEKYRLLLNGHRINNSEGRMVLHHRLRGTLGSTPLQDGDIDCGDFYDAERERIATYATAIRHGSILSPSNQPYTDIVQIGIGGSDLGPRALYYALQPWAHRTGTEIGSNSKAKSGAGARRSTIDSHASSTSPSTLRAHFISNVDPDDAYTVLRTLNPHTTLFILVSKSGTTIETKTNEALAIDWLSANGVANPRAQIVAITSKSSPLATMTEYAERFFIDNHIGGRYSATGAVGTLLLMLSYGTEPINQLLAGAHAVDRCALNPDPLHNPPLLDALCGVYERSLCGYPAHAILPYSQALHRFPAHIQQVDMESNGKSVNRFGEPVGYETGALLFGEPGTNGQHSFYQLLHQGTTITPATIIAFHHTNSADESPLAADSQTLLNANAVAQIVAFARGDENITKRNQHFAGRRPTSLLYGTELTPYTLGALLSFFENRIMFQGFAWNLNSFDQEGVQLGKRLANQVLDGADDSVLTAYMALLSSVSSIA